MGITQRPEVTDIGTSKENVRVMKPTKYSEREEILLGDSFTRAKNLYASLDPATQRSTMRTLNVKQNLRWCSLALSIIIYCVAWHLVPSSGDIGSPTWRLSLLVHLSSIVIFWPFFIAYTIRSVLLALRVKRLGVLLNGEVSDVSDVQK